MTNIAVAMGMTNLESVAVAMGIFVLVYVAHSGKKHISQGGDSGILIDTFLAGAVFTALSQILLGIT